MSIAKQAIWSILLVAFGFIAGHAQTSEPDFMLAINAPGGETNVKCLSGCELMGARDLGNPDAGRMVEYDFGCSGPNANVCGAQVAGWVTKK